MAKSDTYYKNDQKNLQRTIELKSVILKISEKQDFFLIFADF